MDKHKDFLFENCEQVKLIIAVSVRCFPVHPPTSSPFAIRLNLIHPQPSLFLFGLLSPLWCFSTLINYYFGAFFQFESDFILRRNDLKCRDIAPLNNNIRQRAMSAACTVNI